MVPQPTTKKEQAQSAKKETIPFSRIPKNQQVDPRFGSNKYVSYDYADRAYKDLSVTKGKGFTKEKNKKKRGTSTFHPQHVAKSRREGRVSCGLDSSSSDGHSSVDSLPSFHDNDLLGFKNDTFDFLTSSGFNQKSAQVVL